MRSVNKVILIGNLTRDPEMRQTPNGQNVTTFGLATNREWITHDNKKHSLPEFHELVAWAKLADICHQYLKKGKLIYVEGYLKTRSWDTPEGIRKFKTEIIVQDMIMLDKRTTGNEEDYIPEDENTTTNNASINKEKNEARKPVKINATPQIQKKTNEEKLQPKAEPVLSSPATSSTPDSIDIDQDLGL